MGAMQDGGYYLFGSPDADINQLHLMFAAWVESHRFLFDHVAPGRGTRLTVHMEHVAETYGVVNTALSMLGTEANACKKAAAVVVAACKHRPLQFFEESAGQGLTKIEGQWLSLINAEAAYEVACAYAMAARHKVNKVGKAKPAGADWGFTSRPLFPSVHTYVDFVAGMTQLPDAELTVEAQAILVTRVALLIEMCFYRTNETIRGLTDVDFWSKISQSGDPEGHFLCLDVKRNAFVPPSPAMPVVPHLHATT